MSTLAISNDSYKLEIETAAGGSGSATTENNIIGIITLVHLDYHTSAAGGTSVSLQWIPPDDETKAITFATINGNTDLMFKPVVPEYDTGGANSTDSSPGIVGKLRVLVSGAGGALDPAVTARIVIMK
jgi:hypothetical protein